MDFLCSKFGIPEAHMRAAAVVCGTYGSYFLLYSGYKKPKPQSTGLEAFKGSFDINGELSKILGPSKLGGAHSNHQLNKVAALAGLTLSGMAALPADLVWKDKELERCLVLRVGAASLGAHILYSLGEFYKWSPMKVLRGEGKNMRFELLGFCFGCAAFRQFILSALGPAGKLSGDALVAGSALGALHFYFMETRSGLPQDLPVRPWGYVAFLVPGLAVGLYASR